MHAKRLILLLLSLVWLVPKVGAAPSEGYEITPTGVEIPQWGDIGMHDILAAGGPVNFLPPVAHRHSHTAASGIPHVADRWRVCTRAVVQIARPVPVCVRCNRIYLLRNLRL